ncbi:hypothetical protein GCM10007094_21120 [Pseudovibrio japonicus]|uniref:DUF5671 domain-containing protein n=1 Tax=Pseudovibrio japonicus TaxID=366534 RepID=A0ABQ3EH11_9HYPH|nr:DUF5671 domain-containing protein [Pseudovibrio japonicus]GHB32121.1 hypothetical protein GCM10007094_21120 [Pseudovibrio japonicus]
MQIPAALSVFVRDALNKGLSKDDIRTCLTPSSWTALEIDTALNSWSYDKLVGAVPQPLRSTAAWDAVFYALLFAAFGMVIANTLTLLLGLITLWMPEAGDRFSSSGLRGLRWSMAALIIFTPVFVWLHHKDAHNCAANPASKYGGVRRWLTAIAIFAAAMTLLCDAIYLIYCFLDGDLTTRFITKSGAVALLSLVVIQYFRQDRQDHESVSKLDKLFARWLATGLAVFVLAFSFWTVGGPAQGQMEHRDSLRVSDMHRLSEGIRNCEATRDKDLPDELDPMSCARSPQRLTGFASQVTYKKLSATQFQLCTTVEAPERLRGYNADIRGNLYCITDSIK